MKPGIIIRSDGGTDIGMGHIIRCLALADMIKNDFEIAFALQKPNDGILELIHAVTDKIFQLPVTADYNTDAENFLKYFNRNDIVVLDGYNFKTDYQKAIRRKAFKLVCIDDLHSWHQVADVIINHAGGVGVKDYSTENYTKLYLGMDYVLLRKSFLTNPGIRRNIKSIRKVFISMGAADIHNISQKFTEAVLKLNDIDEIHLMLGSINPNLESINQMISDNHRANIVTHFNISAEELKQLLLRCDLAVCPASSISLECCSAGIGLISGFTSENQLGILSGLKKNKAVFDFGDLRLLKSDDITNKISELCDKPELINEMISCQSVMIDRKSPQRILNIFHQLTGGKLSFRFADESDIDLYFKWANDSLVRSNSFNQNHVGYSDHVNWFKSKLKSNDCFFYLFMNEENKPVGQVRIDKSNDEIIIGISVDEAFRGKSVGVDMLEIACHDYLEKNSSSVITAYIKVDNVASYNIFLKAGFDKETIVTEQGIKSYKLNKKLIHNG